MFNAIGGNSKTTFLQTQNDRIHIEFEVNTGVTVYKGMPVKLTTTGKITPWAQADLEHQLLGYAYSDGAAGKLVTVITRGVATIFATTAGAVVCGPVSYVSMDTTTDVGGTGTVGYAVYALEATAAEVSGWLLDQATGAGQLLRVLLR